MIQRNVILGTAGHIDHGKTALVRALTGIDTDRLPEEKRRGITIDLGFAALDLDDVHIALIDVPGHEKFVRNMLAGATAIDMALLVVAADDAVMPQTREHFDILRLLGLHSGAVALSKCDLVDAAWLELVEADVRELVRGSFLAESPIIRTSAQTGLGIGRLREVLRAIALAAPARNDAGYFRMSIDRSFTLEGRGTVVTGTVASGSVRVGDELQLWPQGFTVRVRGLHRHDQKVDCVGSGERAALNLAGVHHTDVRRGCEVACAGYLQPSNVITVKLRSSAEATRPLRHRQRYRLHIGTSETLVRLLLHKGSELEPNSTALAQLVCARPVVSVFEQPFVLRAESPQETLGGGVVLEPTARRLRRRDLSEQSDSGDDARLDPLQRVISAYKRARLTQVDKPALVRETGLKPSELMAGISLLKSAGELIQVPLTSGSSAWVALDTVRELELRVVNSLGRRHAARPRAAFVPRQEVISALADLGSDVLVNFVVDRLRSRGDVIVEAGSVALKTHKPKLSHAETRLKRQIFDAVVKGAFSPPVGDELASKFHTASDVVADILRLLADEGQLVEIGGGVWLGLAFENDLRQRVYDFLSQDNSPGLTIAGLRDLVGTTRKYAVPYGEYLDRVGVTRREGDLRHLGSRPPVEPVRNVESAAKV